MTSHDGAPPHAPEAAFVHSRSVRLHVDVQGPRRAPLVLLIHGWGGGAFDFAPLMEQLSGDHLCVAAVDLRGYGRSDKTPRGYDLTTAASDMAGAVRGLGHTRATVVGHGFGGMVGWTLAAHTPDRVRNLVSLSSAHPVVMFRYVASHPFSQWRLLRRTLAGQVPRLPEHRLVKSDAALAEKIFRAHVGPGFRDTELYSYMAAQRRAAMQVDKVAHLSSEYQRWPFRSRFRPEGAIFDSSFPRKIKPPVLAIDGNMDPNYSSAVARKSAKRAASFRSELLYGVGHYPHIEDPEAVADQIRGLF